MTICFNPVFPLHILRNLHISHNLAKCRYQRLRQPKAKHQLRPCHQQLRGQPLKKAAHPLIPRHVPQNPKPRFRVLEVTVLDACFDDVEGRGDEEGGSGSRY